MTLIQPLEQVTQEAAEAEGSKVPLPALMELPEGPGSSSSATALAPLRQQFPR